MKAATLDALSPTEETLKSIYKMSYETRRMMGGTKKSAKEFATKAVEECKKVADAFAREEDD